MKYIIISPVRNEGQHIENTIQAVISQTIKPLEWIIVNDGSKDNTGDILEKYSNRFDWIKVINRSDRGFGHPGKGIIEAFQEGYRAIENRDFGFIVKLDGDLSFEPDYFENILLRFNSNPRLGIASGKPYVPYGKDLILEDCPDEHVLGASKIYRKECFDQIGGLQPTLSWDTVDGLRAQMLGWETRSFNDLKIIHYRKMASRGGILKGNIRAGHGAYIVGYHSIFMILRGIYRMKERPYCLCGLAMIFGYFKSMAKREERVVEKEVIDYLRQKQIKRLLGMLKRSCPEMK